MKIKCQMCGETLAIVKPKKGDLVIEHAKGVEAWKVQLKGDKKNRELIIDPAACEKCFWGITKEAAVKVANQFADDALDQFAKTKDALIKLREGK